MHGNVLEMLREGRLELGEHVVLEPGVWLTAQAPARIRIGGGTFLNLGVQVAAADLVEIGEHCMLANGCFVTDANHRFDDPDKPVPWQGFTSKGPTRLGDNVWFGANVVVTSGVTIGDRCVIGANSVVIADLPPYSIAAGVPARVIRTIEYPAALALRQHDVHAEHDGGRRTRRGRSRRARRRRPTPRRARSRRASADRAVPSTTSEYAKRHEHAGDERHPHHLEDVARLDGCEHRSALRRQGPAGHRAAPEHPREQAEQRHRHDHGAGGAGAEQRASRRR